MAATKANDLIASIIAIVQAAMSNYQIVKDDTKLLETFHEAGRGLSLINEALSTIKTKINTEITQTAKTSLESCYATATLLDAVFKEVSQAPADARLQSYVAYIERKGTNDLVETLVVGLMEHICILAKNCAMEVNMQEQVISLQDTIEKLVKMEPSMPIKQNGAYHFTNHGTGSQYNATGGTQNNATGNGKQFLGVTFTGAVTFN